MSRSTPSGCPVWPGPPVGPPDCAFWHVLPASPRDGGCCEVAFAADVSWSRVFARPQSRADRRPRRPNRPAEVPAGSLPGVGQVTVRLGGLSPPLRRATAAATCERCWEDSPEVRAGPGHTQQQGCAQGSACVPSPSPGVTRPPSSGCRASEGRSLFRGVGCSRRCGSRVWPGRSALRVRGATSDFSRGSHRRQSLLCGDFLRVLPGGMHPSQTLTEMKREAPETPERKAQPRRDTGRPA